MSRKTKRRPIYTAEPSALGKAWEIWRDGKVIATVFGRLDGAGRVLETPEQNARRIVAALEAARTDD